MSTPVRDSTSASLSTNGRPSRRASARPTAVLPEPIGPIRNTLRTGTVTFGTATLSLPPTVRQRGLSPLATAKETAARRRPSGRSPPRSLDRGTLAQDLGRHE